MSRKIGEIRVYDSMDAMNPVTEIRREWFGQGYVFKDWDAFEYDMDEPCYVPELNDCIYTKRDFLELAEGNEYIARTLFKLVDWQDPNTEFTELISSGELVKCGSCSKLYCNQANPLSDDVSPCPYCGADNS